MVSYSTIKKIVNQILILILNVVTSAFTYFLSRWRRNYSNSTF